jgi:phosphate transport system protein
MRRRSPSAKSHTPEIVSITPSSPPRASIERIDELLIQLFALVGEAIAGATQSLLAGDRETAKIIVERDEQVDELGRQAIALIESELLLSGRSREERRELIALLRLIPDIERNGDLAEHIARRAARSVNHELTPRIRGLIERMGEVCVTIWRDTADCIADRSTTEASAIEDLDDELDELHVALTSELATGELSITVAIELSLIARFYERFGDHAVNLARWIATLDGGTIEPPTHSAD